MAPEPDPQKICIEDIAQALSCQRRLATLADQPPSVYSADDEMLLIETHSLLGSIPEEAIRDRRIPWEITDPLPPAEAERLFLERFNQLTASQR